MKTRTAFLALLTILCLALGSTAFAGVIYKDGGIDGNDNAFYITGPNNESWGGYFQDISNGFVAAASGTPFVLEFGEWVFSGFTPSSISYEIGTSAFGTDLGSGTVATDRRQFLFRNQFGWDLYDVSIGIISGDMTAGNTYWVSLSNATDSQDNDLTEAWDVPNGGSGGPATCNFRQSGINLGDCGLGGESFTLYGLSGTTPEPSSILLFGSGVLALVGVLRRKLSH